MDQLQLGPIGSHVDRAFRLPRMWSNRELVKFAELFHGDVVNVSAGDDIDKEGHHYIDYFSKCRSYSTTNWCPGAHRGYQARDGEILLNLCEPLPQELEGRFDAVFNHTTLEHLPDVGQAMQNLCQLSRDVVILVVPFLQTQHETSGYLDYWRFTPTALRYLFEKHGYTVIYETANDDRDASIYIFQIATRNPDRWSETIPDVKLQDPVGNWLGASSGKKKRGFKRLLPFWRRRRAA